MNVLIAEDEKVTAMLLSRYLQDWGHTVSQASDGHKAWEMVQSGEFHLLISDWNMPNMDGLSLVRNIREGKLPTCYVILLTSRQDKSDLVEALNAGADDFLSKPFDRNELRARLRVGERTIELQRALEKQNRELLDVNERMTRDLLAAARVQKALLPRTLPTSSKAKFAWSFRPCDELAGDNLNVFALDDNHIGLYVADVSGHGVAASLLAVTINQALAPLQTESRHRRDLNTADAAMQAASPSAVIEYLNAKFPLEDFDGNYFTIVYGVLDTRTCEFRFISAGHPPPILISPGAAPRAIGSNGFPIGWMADAQYAENVIRLRAGDRVCIYSDGVPDAANIRSEPFGEARLMESLTSNVSRSIDDCLVHAMLKIESWCGTSRPKDDISMLAIEISDD
jgi:sigma-B regulation protein RsbU (phosphoserine phosphatase)